jgi:hypothetical protein
MSDQQPLLPSHRDQSEGENVGRIAIYREKTAQVLEHRHLHKAVILMIVIDASCVLADLIYTFLSPGCEPPEGADAPEWLEVLAHISLAITTFFLIEIPLSIYAFGFQFYNPFGPVPHSVLHLFDAFIIVTTFILEVVLKGREQELASLLIILRLWRLVKLVGGVAVGVGEVEEETIKELNETRRELQGIIIALSEAKDENHKLRLRLTKYEPGDVVNNANAHQQS